MRAVSKKKAKDSSNVIAVNRKARHDYFIEETVEAGLVLEGWEVKSLRAGRASLAEGYVVMRRGEPWLIGSNIQPLSSASTHVAADPIRTRKLLLHDKEISRLAGAADREGYTLVPLNMHWRHGRAKLDIGLAKGKKNYDKRETKKQQDWKRQKERLLKNRV
ncbi:SsrA-binding protein SmpB [Methylonatrum kenyense]|uniref:SsrA-binding protein SmpB n=1 Tax=Methylonatrum kenyense TaxID=455253 RepID=UPI0020BE77FC|nr:SsrA-binding protein SmpB [Methylonatrum kenyense]MCK8515775.1 SsrA-binding protein SmpB [Methylonatrum kenyense]